MSAAAVAASYPLSPMQQGMLFHSLYSPHSGVDIEQMVIMVHHALDPVALERAWQRVLERHDILRTRFRWEGLDEPLQDVLDHVPFTLARHDWQQLSKDEQERQREAYLQADRRRGFDLAQAPLLRCALFRLTESAYQLVWTFHHILLDGRSFPILLGEVFALEEAFRLGREAELAAPRPYRDYIAWLQKQDWGKAEAYWRQVLKGYAGSTPIGIERAAARGAPAGFGEEQARLTAPATARLKALAEQHKLTLNTFFQGAWALLLSHTSGAQDIAFGATRACRRSALDGAGDNMVGLFINTLPMRVRASPDKPLLDWLREIRELNLVIRPYEHTSLTRIQGWSELPPQKSLFDSILVFENYQLNAALRAQGGAWEQRDFMLVEQPSAPITLAAYADTELLLDLHYDRSRFEPAAITHLVGQLKTLLEAMATDLGAAVNDRVYLTGDLARHLQGGASAPPGGTRQLQLNYWKKRLGGSLPTLSLPFDRPRSEAQSHRSAVHSFALSSGLQHALVDLSQREGATLSMTMLAAFKGLLHLYTQEEDVVVGVPVAARTHTDVPGPSGPWFNTLVLRSDLWGNPSFRTLLERIRATVSEAFAHQDLPFERLLEELRPQGEANRAPLFQVLFVFEPEVPAGMEWTMQPVPAGRARLDLTLLVTVGRDGLRCAFEYDTGLFDTSTIERLAGHLQTLLEGVAANPDLRLAQLPLMTPAERVQILHQWNETHADYPTDRWVHQLFEARAAEHPQQPAVIFDNQALTYGDLNARANQLARHLQTLDVRPDVLVGLCVERSLEMMTGLLGILKAGGAYVPLDPAYPKDRLEHMIGDSQMPVLVTQRHLLDRLPEHSARVVCLEPAFWEGLAGQSRENLGVPVGLNNLVYVIYTSGSTGKPKGVLIEHRSLLNYTQAASALYELRPADRVLQFASISFDASAEEIYPCLTTGATLVLRTPSLLDSMTTFLDRCRDWGVTILDLPTAFWHELASALDGQALNLPPSLRVVIIGGEKALQERLTTWCRHADPRARLVNTYGPTETTIVATQCDLAGPRSIESRGREAPIGRPVANYQAYVLSRDLEPCPVGVPGELHIGGAGLARGYHRRPELTAEKFIVNPLDQKGQTRLYKTGDLVRYRADGQLEFLGRVDFQVKVRGFRIELGEIETVLGQHPGVRDVVIVPRPDAAGQLALVAYVVPRRQSAPVPVEGNGHLDSGVLRTFLKSRLPDYMVPAHFLLLEAFPLSPNGKIDRKALPAPDLSQAHAGRTIVAPRYDVEKDLAPIWEDVLKVKPISVTDNFFELGGHSLQAVVLMGKIKSQLGPALPLGVVFEAPTVEKMAAYMQRDLEIGIGDSHGSLVPLRAEGSAPPLFLVSGIGGHVFTFHKLARLLEEDQPVYGVKAIGVDGRRPPLDRVEDIAAEYLKEITTFYPEGPYLLGGYSVGALVAFELALQLRAQGKQVEFVVVFDSLAPGYPRPLPLYRRLLMHARNFLRSSGRDKIAYVRQRFKNVKERVLWRLGYRLEMAPGLDVEAAPAPGDGAAPPPPALAEEAEILKRVWAALSEASSRYRPAHQFDGKVILFNAAIGPDWAATVFDDPRMGWGQWVAGTIDVQTFPGDHLRLMEDDNIARMAEKLLEYTRAASARRQPEGVTVA